MHEKIFNFENVPATALKNLANILQCSGQQIT